MSGPDGVAVAEAAPAADITLGPGVHNPNHPPARNPRLGGMVPSRTLPAGLRMRWQLPLGRHPYLRFVPGSAGREDCRLRYRASARRSGQEAGAATIFVDHPAPDHGDVAAAAAVEADLSPWARRTVVLELWAEAEGPGCGRDAPASLWQSPAVYGIGPTPHRPGSGTRQNVILIGLDTLRADHLGIYGRQPSPSPVLDHLAAESDVWLEAFSTFNVTNPSFASIFTGLYGKRHGVYTLTDPLDESFTTLAELYSEAGYRTGAILAAGHLWPGSSGLDQGFDTYQFPYGEYAAEAVVNSGTHWISQIEADPFFLWLHFFDPHTPHTPPRPWASGMVTAGQAGMRPPRFFRPIRELGVPAYDNAWLGGHRQLYESSVAYLDHQLGRLLDYLDSRELLENTWIALVADHGENLGEHGLTYQHAGLWDATLHVPLLIRPPGPRGAHDGRRIPGLVQSIDLFPTLLRLTGVGPDPSSLDIDGKDLYTLTENGRGRRVVFAESPHFRGRMVRDHRHLLMDTTDANPQLDRDFFFEVGAQDANLAGTGSPEEERLRQLLDRWWADRPDTTESRPARELDPEERAQLIALGYVDP
ncbi:MAG: sulfatase [Holophagales bacterium]|nr:sulfatase [Holophagales bacterium]